jgi:Mrp family chromosome partitioning ATPase
VLFDCPTANSLDTRMMAKEMDGVLFCTRAGATSLLDVDADIRALRAGGAMLLGVALTMVEAEPKPSLALALFKAKRA